MADSEHRWFRERLAAARAGLLDEQEGVRFEAHLDRCETCRQIWKDYVEDGETEGAPDGHITPEMIARWDETCQSLRGLEREFVRRHLERCPECRQDLEFLGFRPMLSRVSQGEAESISPAKTRDEAAGILPPRTGWLQWALGGWAVAATVALVIALMLPRGNSELPAGPTAGHAILPWVAPRLVRGAEAGSILEIAPGTSWLLLVLRAPQGGPPGEDSFIEVYTPTGSRIVRSPLTEGDLIRGSFMVLLSEDEPLELGVYRVLHWRGHPEDQAAVSSESRFELRAQQ